MVPSPRLAVSLANANWLSRLSVWHVFWWLGSLHGAPMFSLKGAIESYFTTHFLDVAIWVQHILLHLSFSYGHGWCTPRPFAAGSLLAEGSPLGLGVNKMVHFLLTTKMEGMQKAHQLSLTCYPAFTPYSLFSRSGNPEVEKHIFCLSRWPAGI